VTWWDSTITIEKYDIKMIEKYDIKMIIEGKCYMSKIVKWVTQIITRKKRKIKKEISEVYQNSTYNIICIIIRIPTRHPMTPKMVTVGNVSWY
jgi:hypothetical protein